MAAVETGLKGKVGVSELRVRRRGVRLEEKQSRRVTRYLAWCKSSHEGARLRKARSWRMTLAASGNNLKASIMKQRVCNKESRVQ